MATPTQDKQTLDLHVSAVLANADESTPRLAAYAFSADARLLGSVSLERERGATLSIPAPETAARLRVVVGPELDSKAEYAELIRRGAHERHLSVDANHLEHRIEVTLPFERWRWWLRTCMVRGTLHKRVVIGGEHVDFPVCDATIEIYEVDPVYLLIPRLELGVIERLRDLIKQPKLPPGPIPPGPLLPAAPAGAKLGGTIETQQPRIDELVDMVEGAAELRSLAKLGTSEQFRRALIDHPAISRILLCRYFPRWVTMQRVGTAHTDECGHFETRFYQSYFDTDTPDLYFKAKQRVFGLFDVTIHAPTPIACHTWWDYACGTEVNLYTSHPFAQTCSPCPPVSGPNNADRWVAFLAIGAHSLARIHGTGEALQATTTTANRGLTESGAPWGGMLLPRLEFSPGLEAAGVRYYRMSYRKGSSGSFIPLTGTVNAYYRYDVATVNGNMPAWSPHTLGPIAVNDGAGHQIPNLYKIPYHSVAPAGVWDAPPDISEIKEHFASAKFPSDVIAPGMTYAADGATVGIDTGGKYQLKLDLFDAHGQPVDINALGIIYAVPTNPNLTGIINTINAAELGLVVGNSMVVTLHVDNNRCFANIDAPVIGTAAADECCGVLRYPITSAGAPQGDVTLSWRALHPNGFAQYSFRVFRGATLLGIGSSGWTPVTSGGSATFSTAVNLLLDNNLPAGCNPGGCPVAGFSADLYVNALATDGWSSLDAYDASRVRAFVLSNS
jgi:hypothetical protein